MRDPFRWLSLALAVALGSALFWGVRQRAELGRARVDAGADRQAFTVMSQSIKQDLRFSDTQLGLLAGIGFALVYALAAIPIARIAERRNRVVIVALATIGWS